MDTGKDCGFESRLGRLFCFLKFLISLLVVKLCRDEIFDFRVVQPLVRCRSEEIWPLSLVLSDY